MVALTMSRVAPSSSSSAATDRPVPTGDRGGLRPTEADVSAFVKALISPDEQPAELLVKAMLARGVPVERVYLDLFAPAARRLGTLWDDDACDFLQVTDALGRIQRVLHLVEPCWLSGEGMGVTAPRALLACPAGEQHTLGLFVVADFFARDGWDVRVGPPLDRMGLVDAVTTQHVDVVGFSVGCATRLPRLAHDISHVRRASINKSMLVLVGGPPFTADPALATRVGADGTAASADDAPRLARTLLMSRMSGGEMPPPA
jgi:methanogenic corrinoid protein MtbC1